MAKNKQPQTVHSLYGGNRTHNQYWPISQITYEGNKTHSQQYIYLHGRPIALLQTKATGQSDIYYYQNNHLNAPLKLTDKNQHSVWQAEQVGFEFVVHQQDVVQPLRFVGQVEDTETGFYYNYHRYYNPKIGRYTQPDPIGLAGGINPYVYADNNPIMKVDPSGLAYSPLGEHGISRQKAMALPPSKDKCGCFAKAFFGYTEAGVVATEYVTGDYINKPRVGIAGGGRAGSKTSALSTAIHQLNKRYGKNAITVLIRNAGRLASRSVPYIGSALLINDMTAFSKCMKECEIDECQ